MAPPVLDALVPNTPIICVKQKVNGRHQAIRHAHLLVVCCRRIIPTLMDGLNQKPDVVTGWLVAAYAKDCVAVMVAEVM